MSSKRDIRTIYWDACIFFVWIKQETCWPEDTVKGIEQTVEQAYAKRVVILTSVVTLTEILQSQMKSEDKERYRKVFGHPQLQLMDVDRRIAEKAAIIREYYDTRAFDVQPDGTVVKTGSVMSLGDSFHLATALHYEVDEFHTIDGAGKRKRRIDLLKLNGNVAEFRLVIVQPKYIPLPEPLPGGPIITTAGEQPGLFPEEVNAEQNKTSNAETAPASPELSTPDIRGSSNGPPEDQARAEAAEEKTEGKEAGKE